MSIQNANIIFSRIGIIFFSDAGNAILRSIFRKVSEEEFHICRKKKYHLYRTYRKHHISMYVLRKIIFHFPSWKNYHTVFSEKKCHLCWWYKKDHIPVQFFWKDRLFRIFEEYISFPCVFFWERSSFFFGLKNKIKFLRKRNIIFAGDTRKIISSAVFLTRPYFQNIWKKKIWFFM